MCHIPGSHEVLPPLLFVSLEISISIHSALVKFMAVGCDAMRRCGVSQFYPIIRPSYYCIVPHPSYFQACLPHQPMALR